MLEGSTISDEEDSPTLEEFLAQVLFCSVLFAPDGTLAFFRQADDIVPILYKTTVVKPA